MIIDKNDRVVKRENTHNRISKNTLKTAITMLNK